MASTTTSTTSMALIPAAHKLTRVNWEELREIAFTVQGALDAHGADAHDEYATVWEMWTEQLKDVKAQALSEDSSMDDGSSDERAPGWYSSAHDFWEDEKNCPVTDNGVLGGYAHVSPADIKGSETFFTRMGKLRPGWKRELAVDCGAGIGRVSKFLLLPHFERVDLVEQSPRLLQSVPQYIGRHNSDVARVRNLYCMGLQEFQPEPESYDLIWVQWVSSHLTDADFVHFLKRCKQALHPNGWIGVKENTLLSGVPYEIDSEDSSITRYELLIGVFIHIEYELVQLTQASLCNAVRSAVYYVSLFKQAGLTILAKERQQHFPKELYPVTMYALA